jgi:hypothetical protein
MKKNPEIEPSSPNSDHVNRLETVPEGDRTDAQEFDEAVSKVYGSHASSSSTDQPKAETPKAEKPPIKSGGWFAKPPVRKDYIPPAPTSYPMKVPPDYHQMWPIDTANGVGVVYTIPVTHPDDNESKTYVVHPDVVNEALRLCSDGDYTYSILTDKNAELAGEIRLVELHPWVTKTGQFGLIPVMRPIIGNVLSEDTYNNKIANLAENQGKWVRRTRVGKDSVTIPLPPNALGFGEPRWPKVLTDGDWETIISRAFNNRWIKSLNDKVARSLAGLE